ncbi:hypothetical protein I317_07398 [Kwoniella heveanensis CBS 569]|nr:hypothetical protein I317_07398 [Kwoniella heveanensis CBS 569]
MDLSTEAGPSRPLPPRIFPPLSDFSSSDVVMDDLPVPVSTTMEEDMVGGGEPDEAVQLLLNISTAANASPKAELMEVVMEERGSIQKPGPPDPHSSYPYTPPDEPHSEDKQETTTTATNLPTSNLSDASTPSQLPLASRASPEAPTTKPKQKRKRNTTGSSSRRASADHPAHWLGEDNSIIRCICGFTEDDGFTIQCEGCGAWEHGLCFGYMDESQAPESYFCELCRPRPFDAVTARHKQTLMQQARAATGETADPIVEKEKPRSKGGKAKRARMDNVVDGDTLENREPAKESSPGVMGPPAIKPKRRQQGGKPRAAKQSTVESTTPGPSMIKEIVVEEPEDDYFRVDPWLMEYTPISQNIIRGSQARQIMRNLYKEWVDAEEEMAASQSSRTVHNNPSGLPSPTETGIIRLSPDSIFPPPDFSILAPPVPPVFLSGPDLEAIGSSTSIKAVEDAPSFLPLTYAENISKHGVYTRPTIYGVFADEPVMQGSFIGEFRGEIVDCGTYRRDPINQYASLGMPKPHVRSIGPPINLMIDARGYGCDLRFVRSGCHPNVVLRPLLWRKADGEPPKLKFGLFAARDIGKKTELILGWEWDDQHVVHSLRSVIHAAMLTDGSLASPSFSITDHKARILASKIDSVLTHIFGTFTACACVVPGTCALAQMSQVVDPKSMQNADGHGRKKLRVDLGELVGAVRGWRRREVEAAEAKKWKMAEAFDLGLSGMSSRSEGPEEQEEPEEQLDQEEQEDPEDHEDQEQEESEVLEELEQLQKPINEALSILDAQQSPSEGEAELDEDLQQDEDDGATQGTRQGDSEADEEEADQSEADEIPIEAVVIGSGDPADHASQREERSKPIEPSPVLRFPDVKPTPSAGDSPIKIEYAPPAPSNALSSSSREETHEGPLYLGSELGDDTDISPVKPTDSVNSAPTVHSPFSSAPRPASVVRMGSSSSLSSAMSSISVKRPFPDDLESGSDSDMTEATIPKSQFSESELESATDSEPESGSVDLRRQDQQKILGKVFGNGKKVRRVLSPVIESGSNLNHDLHHHMSDDEDREIVVKKAKKTKKERRLPASSPKSAQKPTVPLPAARKRERKLDNKKVLSQNAGKRGRAKRIVSSSASEGEDDDDSTMDLDDVSPPRPPAKHIASSPKSGKSVKLERLEAVNSIVKPAQELGAIVPDQVAAPMSSALELIDVAVPNPEVLPPSLEEQPAPETDIPVEDETVPTPPPKEPTPPPPEPPKKVSLSDYLKNHKFRKEAQTPNSEVIPVTVDESTPAATSATSASIDGIPGFGATAPVSTASASASRLSNSPTKGGLETPSIAHKLNLFEHLPTSRPALTGLTPVTPVAATPSTSYVPRSVSGSSVDYFPPQPSATTTLATPAVTAQFAFVPRVSSSYTPRQASGSESDVIATAGAAPSPSASTNTSYLPRASASEDGTPQSRPASLPAVSLHIPQSPRNPPAEMPPPLPTREPPPHTVPPPPPPPPPSTSAPAYTQTSPSASSSIGVSRLPPTGPKVPPTGPRGLAGAPPIPSPRALGEPRGGYGGGRGYGRGGWRGRGFRGGWRGS